MDKEKTQCIEEDCECEECNTCFHCGRNLDSIKDNECEHCL
jgi:hypothetical protein